MPALTTKDTLLAAAATFVRFESSAPVYTARTKVGLLLASNFATPFCVGRQRYHTEVAVAVEPPRCTGSPGSLVAPLLFPVSCPELPSRSRALANASLRIIRQVTVRFPRELNELLPTAT